MPPTELSMVDTALATHDVESAPILVVDDEESVAAVLGATISSAGYETHWFTDPREALNAIRSRTFSVVLTDQKMPHVTGLEFLEEVRRVQPNATRLLITALLNLDTVIGCINRGEIYRFIVKPWYREELIATIHNGVQRYQLICRNTRLQERTTALNRELQSQVSYIGEQNDHLVKLNQTLRENLDRSLDLCLRMLEAFLPPLGSQARRVHHLCCTMAEILSMPQPQARVLEVAGWLHDIGLIAAPRSLVRTWLADPNSISAPDLALIQQHPALGATLAHFAQPLDGVATAIRSHHEHFDGSGYPDGLEGDEIPWAGKLLAVAVGYASSASSPASALEETKLASGRAYDPEAVRVFLRALPKVTLPARQAEVLLSELRPGMTLARGIYTSSGLLLVPEGQRLTEVCIEKVRNHNKVNPIQHSLLVYC